MRVLNITEKTSDTVISEAVRVLKDGGLVAYPTESFYALGVPATDEEAVMRLFELKKRPPEKALPLIVGDMDILASIVTSIPAQAKALIEEYWPGPLNILFEAQKNLPLPLTGGSNRVAVRIPGDRTALKLARAAKLPITATSANPSGQPPAQTVSEVKNYFDGKVDVIIDAGATPGGRPSTIVDATVTPLIILREGSIVPGDR
jgi:L-threonylcarbamoyladenylate synthase